MKSIQCELCKAEKGIWLFRGIFVGNICKKILLSGKGAEYLNYRRDYLLQNNATDGLLTPEAFVGFTVNLNEDDPDERDFANEDS